MLKKVMSKIHSWLDNGKIPEHIKAGDKVVGYFSYNTEGTVFCEGDACIIASSEASMKTYLKKVSKGRGQDLIRKTRFAEIVNGLRQRGAYAFDRKAYALFFEVAQLNGINWLPAVQDNLETSSDGEMRLIILKPSN